MSMLSFHIYRDAKGEYRWRLRAANGKVIADSGEGYVDKADCWSMADYIRKSVAGAVIHDDVA